MSVPGMDTMSHLCLTLGAGNVARSVVYLLSLHVALSHINWVWWSLRKWRQEDFQFKVILEYLEFKANLRYLGACLKNKTNKQKAKKKITVLKIIL